MEVNEENYLAHYGVLRRSGRYPWGSGKSPEERSVFLGTVEDLRKNHGMSEAEIAKSFDMTTSQLRALKSIARNEQKQAEINMAQRLKDKGWSNVEIGKRMGRNESYIRTLLAPGEKDKADVLEATSSILKSAIDEKHYVDIGSGVSLHMGVSTTKLNTAVARLVEEGYTVHYVKVEQLGTGKNTSVKVLAAPGTTYSEVYRNRDHIQQVMGYSEDGGRTYDRILPPKAVSSKRVAIRYAEQGGSDSDGVIYLRPGVKDLEMGSAHYAQVRISVDGTHYLKGMAMYRDDLPEGVDLLFNTNKSNTGNKLDALKPMYKDDPDIPFGAVIKRQIQEGEGANRRVTSAVNIVNEEGDWEKWSKSLSSQMLSKQSNSLAFKQLGMMHDRRAEELKGIMRVDNPAVRRKLLKTFADSADSSAVHLKAAALPRQASHIILPITSMKPTEVYAPNFNDGEKVVLIRYPHGGKFEIPELTVNNKNREARKNIGLHARDAIGIHPDVAARLSGADFDGDSVLVIPNNDGKIKTEAPLEGLKGFDPHRAYPAYEGMKRMTKKQTGLEMGMISNLITDMTIRGAPNAELARAVRHSMVVIDAEKHNLNWKQSAIDNGIQSLKEKYQRKANGRVGGASTIISRANADVRVNEHKPRSAEEGGPIDPSTGRKVYEPHPISYVDREGNTAIKQRKSKQLAETDNAHTLSSGTPIEEIYANHSNRMKELANQARKELYHTKSIPYSPEAKAKYAEEVKELDANLRIALRNSPRERQAQIVANAILRAKKQAMPEMDKSTLKKVKAQALADARIRVGARKTPIEITPKQWEAIQAGAITNHKLTQILDNADLDKVKELATPKDVRKMSDTKKAQAAQLLARGYTQAQVAQQLGVSVSTLKRSFSVSGE